jgi:glycolate oxidase iron-sulfur subunit
MPFQFQRITMPEGFLYGDFVEMASTGGKAHMRANIDAWWPFVDPTDGSEPVEAIVMNASGCGVMVKDYGHVLADDPAYASKAERISALTKDLSELLPDWVAPLRARLRKNSVASDASGAALPVLAYHPPCTLQHGQQLRGGVEQHLSQLGFSIAVAQNESHLCCGSAGTYSVLNPGLSKQLRDRKLGNLSQIGADTIVSANVGCISHLQSGTDVPVKHWIEVLDAALQAQP